MWAINIVLNDHANLHNFQPFKYKAFWPKLFGHKWDCCPFFYLLYLFLVDFKINFILVYI